MTAKPVVVYGASGYTGRLICEYLREYNVPFVAAGRDAARIEQSMQENVAGIETADYEVAEACLAAGTHYLDTTGEQDWMMTPARWPPGSASTAMPSPITRTSRAGTVGPPTTSRPPPSPR
ncbi:hypothetical protein GCM10010172_34160 [Paractinoplanes ferrugineus]|uniref:Uncharacterized protein n=1 Tax=Paractinoplanes ferrugineus TaxID=113564 RepID=A0A919J7W8_9ACTN|nr:hypothetical protein [Actinoplanes ferrugineus]GIE14653.1 hypothetical protein Afe05nite_64930 [Actinoplanes ferrugineus]